MPDAISAPEKRYADYIRAFTYYVKNYPEFNRVVFIENSGWPLDVIRQAGLDNPHGKLLEFISLNENHYPREFGKGYGEHNLIANALKCSKLINGHSYVAKMTGRICLANMREILNGINDEFDMLCDFRDHPFYEIFSLPLNGRYCDTRFIVFRPDFFRRHLQELTHSHSVGDFSIENNYYRILKSLDDGKKVICRFQVEPKYRGTAGHGNKNYSGIKELAKQTIRGLSRQILPGLRI